MGRFEDINQILRTIERKDPGYVDTLDDNAVNELQEVKDIRKRWRIKNFKVNRDNEFKVLGDGSATNIGGNRLISFKYDLIPDI
jgi:hypothetical protein